MELIRDSRQIYDNYNFKTEILAASIRSANHVNEDALAIFLRPWLAGTTEGGLVR